MKLIAPIRNCSGWNRRSHSVAAPLEKFLHMCQTTSFRKNGLKVSLIIASTKSSRGSKTRYAYITVMMGQPIDIETEIHDFEENKGWTGKATKGIPHKTYWVFKSVDEGTKMTYALEYELDIPLIGKWLDNTFMKPQWEKIISNSLENLKSQFIRQ